MRRYRRYRRFPSRVLVPLAALLVATGSASAPDDLDTFVMDQMTRRHIAGLSLAVMQDGKIVEIGRAHV